MGANVSDEGIVNVSICCPNLTSLKLEGASKISFKGILAKFDSLEKLILQNIDEKHSLTELGLCCLVKSCPKLVSLHLSDCKVTGKYFEYLRFMGSKWSLNSLEELILTNCFGFLIIKYALADPDIVDENTSNITVFSDNTSNKGLNAMLQCFPNLKKIKISKEDDSYRQFPLADNDLAQFAKLCPN